MHINAGGVCALHVGKSEEEIKQIEKDRKKAEKKVL
jgi:hypothetical protein